jgi:TIR domain
MWDVFVSYRWVSPDQEWVRNQLVPRLREAGLRVLLDVDIEDGFVPGRDAICEMTRAGRESLRTLSVWSPDYFCDDRAVWFESLQARRKDPQGRNSALVPLLLRRTRIPGEFFGLVPVDWTDPIRRAMEWRRLLAVLSASNHDVVPPDACAPEDKDNDPCAPVTADAASHHVLAQIVARLKTQDPVERYWLYIALGSVHLPEADELLAQAAEMEADAFARIGIDDARELRQNAWSN